MKYEKGIFDGKKLIVLTLLILLVSACIAGMPGNAKAEDIASTRGDDGKVIVWKENSTHYIDRKYQIYEGETLIIEPGVKVYFSYAGPSNANPYSLRIRGKLTAQGEPDNPIIFTSNASNPAPNDWDKIKFHSSADETSIMEHCIVEYSIQGIQTDRADVTIRNNVIRNIGKYGVKVVKSSPMITNNTISSRNIGVRILGGSVIPNPTIEGNVFEDCDYYGILADSGTTSMISNNVFRNSGEYGIYVTNAGPTIRGNTFEDNKIGIALMNAKGKIVDNDIRGSGEYGIFISYAESLTIKDNVFADNAAGISASNARGSIEDNEFKGDQDISVSMIDSEMERSDNEHNGIINSFKHIVLQTVNDDGYPIMGASLTVKDAHGTEVTSRELGEESTLMLNLQDYEIDPSGTKESFLPYTVAIEKNGITTDNKIDSLTEPLVRVKLEDSFVPRVSITSQQLSEDTLTISGEVDIDDLDTSEMDWAVMVRLEGGEWEEAVGKAKWSYAGDAEGVNDGDAFEVKVVDGIRDPTVKSNVESSVEIEDTGTQLVIFIILCIGVAVMTGVLLFIYFKRRR